MVYVLERKSVEPTVPIWARDIRVEPIVFRGRTFLKVTGTGVFRDAIQKDEAGIDLDLLGLYLEARRRRDVRSAPHVVFSNCRTDEELVAFIRKFGPIWTEHTLPEDPDTAPKSPESCTDPQETPQEDLPTDPESGSELPEWVHDTPIDEEGTITVLQDLDSARHDRAAFSDLLRLVATLTPEEPEERRDARTGKRLVTLLRGSEVGPLLRDLKRGHGFLNSPDIETPSLPELSQLVREAHEMVCGEFNRIKFHLVPFLDSTKKQWRLTVLPRVWSHGILPALYLMLREDYIRGRRLGICGRLKCSSAFVIKRLGQRYCSDDCSRRQRQYDYYQSKGKFTRKKLRDARRKKNASV
ncbi:MAG TPA: hypothetical protein PLB02_00435 [Thermoanaerobaculia bacterium]|nr:hypothetical protein [Thermoanaerobaculia bacterium]